MLAFVFQHWPAAGADEAVFARRLARLHAELAEEQFAGYAGSTVFRMDAPPGLAAPGAIYSDWYLVNGWESLGRLNTAAVSGRCAEPHRAVAQMSGGGQGSIYELRNGTAHSPAAARHSYWFRKPAGMSYAELDAALDPLYKTDGVAVWRRQMTLGPCTEFCLTSAKPVSLPAPIVAEARPMTRI